MKYNFLIKILTYNHKLIRRIAKNYLTKPNNLDARDIYLLYKFTVGPIKLSQNKIQQYAEILKIRFKLKWEH